MSQPAQADPGAEARRLFRLRDEPTDALGGQADAVAAACHAMAVRFHRGGRLVVFGTGGPSADAQHVAVEFVHPVIVGKRALPAISLTADVATVTGIAERDGIAAIFSHQLRYLAGPADIALGISTQGISTQGISTQGISTQGTSTQGTSSGSESPSVLAGLQTAREIGMLTVALVGGDGPAAGRAASRAADHVLVAGSADPRVGKEMHVTLYHVLWELVHVFFEQPGVLGPGVVA